MCYTSKVVTYSATIMEVGDLDENVTAFFRVTSEYLTVAFMLFLFV